MKELSRDIMADVEKEREELLRSINVKVLDDTRGAESFNAIIDSRRGIKIY